MSKKATDSQLSPANRGLIAVIPMGKPESDVLHVVADSLQGILRLPVDVREPIPMPEETFLASRNQYNAMAIIKYLDVNYADSALKILGVTAKDIANPILTHVFGEAYMDGRTAVMSSFRLGRNPGGKPVSREQFLDRVVKVAIHEIGHTFNIPHCQQGRCVMRASNSLIELDDKLNYLCSYCELFLSEALTAALKKPDREMRRTESA
ncbi:MAG: archaemetzincin family Zn-dependent metalloprotease [Deltaproteobacteria bacterium]